MISLRKTVSELEKLDEFRRTALESYALTIGATGEHVVEIDASQAASFRSRIEALRKLVQPNTAADQLIEIQSSFKGELREYSEKAKQVMERLRNDVRAASTAMEAFAATFAASGMDLDDEVKRELQRLDKAGRVDDLNEIRQIIRGVSSGIASSVERMRQSNELAIVQLKDEIRLLHQELKSGRQSPAPAQLSASSSQRKESLAQIDSLVRQEVPFSLMLIAVKNFQGLQRCYAKIAIENAFSSLHARLEDTLPSGSRANRWADFQFLAILTVEPAKALVISRDLSKKLSGTYAGQDNTTPVALDVISGVIDWKTQSDPALLTRRLDQLSDTLSKT